MNSIVKGILVTEFLGVSSLVEVLLTLDSVSFKLLSPVSFYYKKKTRVFNKRVDLY